MSTATTAIGIGTGTGTGTGTQNPALDRAIRKNLIRLVPLLAVAYFFNYIDRTNVGFAALTMNRDLGLTEEQFGLAGGLFFLGYCLLEVPSNMALYRFGARRWLARIMISWGLLSAACALAQGPTSFNLLRIATGAAEAGFFPGVLFYLSCWFPSAIRVRVLAWFLVAIPLSSAVGGPLSAWLLSLNGWLGLAGWQWLFVMEGLPAMLMGVLTLLLLCDRPQEAGWLTEAERDALLTALASEEAARPKKKLLAALCDPKVLMLSAILFCYWIGITGIAIWLPLMLKNQGLDTFDIGLLSALPYLVGSVVMIFWARQMDRTRQYLWNMTAALGLTAAGLGFGVIYPTLVPALIGMTIAVVGLSSVRPAFYSLPSRYLSGAAAAGGLAFINSVGSLGGTVGPWMMGALKARTGGFEAGMAALAASLVLAAVVTVIFKRMVRES